MRELEEKFFETFGIEPDTSEVAYFTGNMGYPKITDRQLLDLYCICCKAFNLLNINSSVAFEFDVEDLKNRILKRLIWVNDTYKNKEIKHQVQELFKEN